MIPQFNSSGVHTGNVYHITTEWPFACVKNDGVTIGTSVGSGNQLEVVLKVDEDLSIPKVLAATPIVHVFSLTTSQMSTKGFDADTTMKISLEAGGNPVPDNYWVICCCQLEGPDPMHLKYVCGKRWVGKLHIEGANGSAQ